MTAFAVHRNGRDADVADLAPLAFAGYAHFTAMQVRGRRVRGLDLHLERLRAASLRLFGLALPDDRVRECLRRAIDAGPADVSLTATMYLASGEFTVAAADEEPDLLVRTGPASSGPDGPLAVSTTVHERFLPDIKHVGEVAKTWAMRQAAIKGFDDALFVDRGGRLSEGSIWNLAFWDGHRVIWPAAEMLTGTTMGIVRRQLDRRGVPQVVQDVTSEDVRGLAGAVVMNSWTPGVPISRIDSATLPEAPEFLALLHDAYAAESTSAP